jgi:hypothetical protein
LVVTPIYLEKGRASVFAVALEWPGWCRRAPTSELAIEELVNYRPRYRAIVGRAFDPGDVEVIGEVSGNATTDFGAPGVPGPWDEIAMETKERERHVDVLLRCWRYFDDVVREAPEQLRKGPRGGGRDRDAIALHVREAERAYGSKLGTRIPPRAPWNEQRTQIVDALAATTESRWPRAYAIRRLAWHITDHAWEIQDKST